MISYSSSAGFGRVEQTRPSRGSVKRFAGGCLLVFLMGFASGCYTYAPMPAAPAPGTEVVVGLNDQGRVSLGQRVGPGGPDQRRSRAKKTGRTELIPPM